MILCAYPFKVSISRGLEFQKHINEISCNICCSCLMVVSSHCSHAQAVKIHVKDIIVIVHIFVFFYGLFVGNIGAVSIVFIVTKHVSFNVLMKLLRFEVFLLRKVCASLFDSGKQ